MRVVSDLDTAQSLGIKPGQKLCPTCLKGGKEIKKKCDTESLEETDEDLYESHEDLKEKLDTSFKSLGCSYCSRKVSQIVSATKVKIAEVMGTDESEFDREEDKTHHQSHCDSQLHRLTKLVKEKCKISPRQEKLRLLTLVPGTWTIKQISEKFGVSNRLVKQARQLKKEKGILGEPESKKGRTLNMATIQRVRAFYEDDEYSRMWPSKKEFVSVRVDVKKVHKQKRLLLLNLNELYIQFKKQWPNDKIGFSKFCELRPKWCITVNSFGMHSVCVCQIHQNIKPQTHAIPHANVDRKADPTDYKYLLSLMVCDMKNRSCMLRSCSKCPGVEPLKEHIETLFESAGLDGDDMIKFSQWVSTDRTELFF